jgi:hypothetical protein
MLLISLFPFISPSCSSPLTLPILLPLLNLRLLLPLTSSPFCSPHPLKLIPSCLLFPIPSHPCHSPLLVPVQSILFPIPSHSSHLPHLISTLLPLTILVLLLPLNSRPSHSSHPLATQLFAFPCISSSCRSKAFPNFHACISLLPFTAPPFQSTFLFLSCYPLSHRVSFLLFIPSSYSTYGFPFYRVQESIPRNEFRQPM